MSEPAADVRWVIPEAADGEVSSLVSALDLHPLAAQVLVNRGYRTSDEASAFLRDGLEDLPNPFLMKGMPEAAERVHRALRERQKITLYGDYDVDGVCSTALLNLFLRELGGQVATYIPHRLAEGYGLNVPAVERIAADGTALLVTLDCGITSQAEVARAKALGLDVIVVDHHTVPESLPAADAILNPHQPGCAYPYRYLCAAGVAFNLCMALRRRLRDQGAFVNRKEPNLKSMLDLVALATVADVMPLTGVNRILVKHGLGAIAEARRPGVRALKEVAAVLPTAAVSAGQVGFRLGPRINAAGRLDDASVGFRLLCSTDMASARPLAEALEAANQERRGIEQEIFTSAIQQAEQRGRARGLVLHSDQWHPGVIGIVASRLVERFHRPTVMVAVKGGAGRGSARSIERFHLYEALQECSAHLSRLGGHKHAAGLSIDLEQLPAFTNAFEQAAARRLSEEDLVPCCRVDAVVSLPDLGEDSLEAIQRLAPFGQGNPEPVLASWRVAARPRLIASKREGQADHLKLSIDDAPRLSAIGFGMGKRMPQSVGSIDLAFQLAVDEWQGVSRLSLRLKDLRPAS